jgi:hypothetical protein
MLLPLPHLRVLDLRNNRLTLKGLQPLLQLAKTVGERSGGGGPGGGIGGGLPSLTHLRLQGNPALEEPAVGGDAPRLRAEVRAALDEAGLAEAAERGMEGC